MATENKRLARLFSRKSENSGVGGGVAVGSEMALGRGLPFSTYGALTDAGLRVATMPEEETENPEEVRSQARRSLPIVDE